MGRKDGLIQLTGSIWKLLFYKTKDGFLAVGKGASLPIDQIRRPFNLLDNQTLHSPNSWNQSITGLLQKN